jgi:hypothetical protein
VTKAVPATSGAPETEASVKTMVDEGTTSTEIHEASEDASASVETHGSVEAEPLTVSTGIDDILYEGEIDRMLEVHAQSVAA